MKDKIEILKTLNTEKLIDVVKNYRQYGYDDTLRNSAIDLLKEKGISIEHLKISGNFENKTFDFATDLYKSFKFNSKIAFVFYGLILLTNILVPVFRHYLESFSTAMTILNLFIILIFLIFLIKSFINQNEFFKIIGKDFGTTSLLMYFFFGMPIYIIMYFYFKKQMDDEMKLIK